MQKILSCLCLCAFGILTATSLPYQGFRVPRSSYAQRALMFSGYYSRPNLNRRSTYFPEGAMTAFASGDTLATNSYLGGEQFDPVEDSEVQLQEEPTDKVLSSPEAPPPIILEGSETTDANIFEEAATEKPKRVPKKKYPLKPTPAEEEEEQDEDQADNVFWPFKGGQKVPSYNTFFPIVIGGYPGGARARSDSEGFYPGSATAIANSFSTGKGGVASSHATSFGDPYLSMLLRNGFFKRKNSSVQEEKL